MRFLIVDDNELTLRAMKLLVDSADGLEVAAEARSGREALEIVAAGGIDAIIMDVGMPELDGPATLRALRVRHPDLPVLMCSAAGEVARQECMEAGATAFCTKEDLPSGLHGMLVALGWPKT